MELYTTLWYPIPKNSHYYKYINTIPYHPNKEEKTNHTQEAKEFSRESPCDLLPSYIEYITRRWRLYRSLPFVRQIYLCNSITFNALHPNSDIDFYIITSKGYLRRARFRSLLFFSLTGLKRSLNNKKMKICLSFYTDEQHSNLYHLRKTEWDIYLSFRLAHNVLLYTDETLSNDYIWQQNKALLEYLPYHPLCQTIELWLSLISWSSWGKKTIELFCKNKIWKTIQYIFSTIRKKILLYKTKSLSRRQQNEIIISNTMLKFHDDKRPLYQFRTKNKNSKTKW